MESSVFEKFIWFLKYFSLIPQRKKLRRRIFPYLSKWQIVLLFHHHLGILAVLFIEQNMSYNFKTLSKITRNGSLISFLLGAALNTYTYIFRHKDFWKIVQILEEMSHKLDKNKIKSDVTAKIMVSISGCVLFHSLCLVMFWSYSQPTPFSENPILKLIIQVIMTLDSFVMMVANIGHLFLSYNFMLILASTVDLASQQLLFEIRVLNSKLSFEKFQDLKIRHQFLRNLVFRMDKLFSFPIFIMYAFSLTSCCFDLTAMILENDPYSFLIGSFKYVTTIPFLLYTTLNFSKLSKSFEEFHVLSQKIEIYNLNELNLQQLNLFILQTSVPEVGLTGCGCFLVNKKFILSLLGALSTYSVFALQVNSITKQ